jgi:hypothetical protein
MEVPVQFRHSVSDSRRLLLGHNNSTVGVHCKETRNGEGLEKFLDCNTY